MQPNESVLALLSLKLENAISEGPLLVTTLFWVIRSPAACQTQSTSNAFWIRERRLCSVYWQRTFLGAIECS